MAKIILMIFLDMKVEPFCLFIYLIFKLKH
jgi:hypothetical protein